MASSPAPGIRRVSCGRLGLGPAIILAALLLVGTGKASAQGIVRGTVRADDGRPLAVVYVLAYSAADARLNPVSSALTDREGVFTLRDVPEGTHWLRVRRVGWQLSDPVRVTVQSGETVVVDLPVVSRPVALSEFRIVAEAPCTLLGQLPAESPVLELFSSAADAVRARRAISEHYRYRVHRLAEEIREGSVSEWITVEDTTVIVEPQGVAGARAAAPAERADDLLFGRYRRSIMSPWRHSISLIAPSDALLLSEAFRRTYCVLTSVERSVAGDPMLRFRRASPDPKIVAADVRILFDRVSARVLEIEYDYRLRERPVGLGMVEFSSVLVEGATFAWFTAAEFSVFGQGGANDELLRKRFRFTPSDFERARE